MPASGDVPYSHAATGDATRIARYLHLVVELPKEVVDAGNVYASSRLAAYKRDELIEALAVFMKPADRELPQGSYLLARLLRRAIRHRHGRDAQLSPDDPRDDANGMLIVLLAGVGMFLIDNFMRSPLVRSYIEANVDTWSEERKWLTDLSDHPDPLGRAMSTEERNAAHASESVVQRWGRGGGWGGGGDWDTDDGDAGFDGDWGFD